MSATLRLLGIAVAIGCFVFLTAWRLGPPTTFFEEEGAIARAATQLSAAGGFERVKSIEIAADRVQIEAQDPKRVSHVNRWRLVKRNIRSFNWEAVEGPEPMERNVVGGNLEDSLFNLSEVDFAAAQELMKEAVARAALDYSFRNQPMATCAGRSTSAATVSARA